jgi:hypothetical protein
VFAHPSSLPFGVSGIAFADTDGRRSGHGGALPKGSLDKSGEKGMRAVGTGFEFGMKLRGDEEGMVRQLNGFHEFAVGRDAA